MKTKIGLMCFLTGALGITSTMVVFYYLSRANTYSVLHIVISILTGLALTIFMSVKSGKTAVNIEINSLLDVRKMLKEFYTSSKLVYNEPTDYEIAHPVKFIFNELNKIDRNIISLKKEISKHERIFDNMKEGIIIADNEGNIITINPSAKDIFNVNENNQGSNLVHIIKDSKIITATRNIAEKKGIDNKELSITDRNGNNYYVFISRVDLGHDQSEGIIIYIRDMTSIIRAERIRSEFAANVSHELKTPLTSIKGFTELLKAGSINDSETRTRYLELILLESERLINLINDILMISELESITIDEGKTSVNVASVAKETVDMLTPVADKQQVRLQLESSSSCIIDANPSRIKELFINLIENGIKYNKEKGTVKISVECTDTEVVILIEDTGIGIPEAEHDRIFERFYRVDKSRSKATGGTGLGLSIVKHIVKLYKGVISLESSVGKGTAIKICLPKAVGPNAH